MMQPTEHQQSAKMSELASLRATLDDMSSKLDATTQAQLQMARQRALSEGLNAKPIKTYTLAMAASIALVLTLSWLTWAPDPEAPQQPDASALLQNIELLTSEEEFEMLQDLEFYQWLDNQQLLSEDENEANT
ncbi:MAG: hypothetical protein HWE13_08825 [Gammaproteobacteria bacterium]|nr:hypothetical protein [Gammaproteobacteria bacterium]NVK88218.1 hypothetical protein [Gammaproteobacteria bacterium]